MGKIVLYLVLLCLLCLFYIGFLAHIFQNKCKNKEEMNGHEQNEEDKTKRNKDGGCGTHTVICIKYGTPY